MDFALAEAIQFSGSLFENILSPGRNDDVQAFRCQRFRDHRAAPGAEGLFAGQCNHDLMR